MNRLKLATQTALVFFTIGTLIFLLQIFNKNECNIAIIGFYYVLFAIGINSIIIIALLVDLCINTKKTETLKSIGVILLNVPIALLYFQIIVDYLL